MTMTDERPAKKCPMCQHPSHKGKQCGAEAVFMTKKVHCACDFEAEEWQQIQ